MKNNTYKLRFLTVVVIFVSAMLPSYGQNGVRISRVTGAADASAMLDLVTDGTPTWRGLLIPRMTSAQRAAISSPASGLLVYQTDGSTGFYYWDGGAWAQISSGGLSGSGNTNNLAKWTSTTNVGASVIVDNGSGVGIGASPDASAKLDVSDANRGILLPQVSLTSVTDISTITSPATSLIVYNTNSSITNGAGTGLYTYNGSAWQKLATSSTPFTNWGTNVCPSTSTIVYSGFAASGNVGHSGSGANMQCLIAPANFTGATNTPGVNENGALFYGAEITTTGYGALTAYAGYDVTCAVCLARNSSITMMVPGTVSCPGGWTQQYWGYLMSSHYTQNKSEFICVFNTPVNGAAGTTVTGGASIYPVEAELGSLAAASGYIQNREVECSVCTK